MFSHPFLLTTLVEDRRAELLRSAPPRRATARSVSTPELVPTRRRPSSAAAAPTPAPVPADRTPAGAGCRAA